MLFRSWEIEFTLLREVAFEAGFGIAPGIDDELPRAGGCDVLAARAVAGFTPALPGHRARSLQMNPRVRTRGECADVVGVAIKARTIADVICSWNFQRRHDSAGNGRTGNKERPGHHTRGAEAKDGTRAKKESESFQPVMEHARKFGTAACHFKRIVPCRTVARHGNQRSALFEDFTGARFHAISG